MTNHNPSVKNIMGSIIPITRFNRGEANKIFEEVSETGIKIVLKNNVPVAVLVAPKQYDAMIEMLEDYALLVEAENRMKKAEAKGLVSYDQVKNDLGINDADLDDVDVEIE